MSNSVFHWGAESSAALPATLVLLSPNILASDVYFSTSPITQIKNKVEYTIPCAKFDDVIMELTKTRLSKTVPITLSNKVKDVLPNLAKIVSELTSEDSVYLTVPLAGVDHVQLHVPYMIDKDLTVLIHEKIFSTLLHVSGRSRGIVANLNTCINGNYFIPIYNYATNKNLIINGINTSPCSLCKQRDKKVNGYCIFFNNDLECLFTNALPSITDDLVDSNKLATILSKIPIDDTGLVDQVGDFVINGNNNNKESLDAFIDSIVDTEEEGETDYAFEQLQE